MRTRSSDGPLRVAIVGLGRAGLTLHLPALDRIRGVEVVLGCDPDPRRRALARAIPTSASSDAIHEAAIDAVVIASPAESHAALAFDAIASGLDLYVEKPLATTLDDADAIAGVVAGRGLVLQVGFAYRHHPLWQRLFALHKAGRVVAPWHAVGQFDGRPGVGWDQPIVDVGCHHVDLLSNLAGEPPAIVAVVASDQLVAHWADGSCLEGTYGPGTGVDQVVIRHQDGVVRLDRRRGLRLRGGGWRAAVPSPSLVRSQPARTGWERSFELALRGFVRSCRTRSPATPGADDGVRGVRIGAAILRSAGLGAAQRVA